MPRPSASPRPPAGRVAGLRAMFVPLREWRRILLDTYTSWRAHRTTRLAAGLAYYGLFAIVPLLTVSVALAGIVLDDIEIEERLTEALTNITGGESDAVAAAITESIEGSGPATGLGLIGLGTLLLAASLVFVALQDAFDTIWEVPVGSGARNTLRRRGLAFAVVLLGGAVLIVGFAMSTIAGLVRSLAPGDLLLFQVIADLVSALGSWALVAAVLTVLTRLLTRAEVHWRIALLGAVFTALALTVGNRVVAEYLQRWGAASLAGAAGAIAVVLFWVYAIAQILLIGAELTRSMERTIGSTLDRAPEQGVSPGAPGYHRRSST